MTIEFNSSPYFDDFDPANNYHRILFKPGYAVQARELTQAQTILQDQVTKFADNIFKQNSPVAGGQVTTNLNCYYIKLTNPSGFDVTQWNGLTIKNATGNILAKVLAVVPATGTSATDDPPTLIVSYLSGTQFSDGQTIYDVSSSATTQSISSGSTGQSSVCSIAEGVFYVLGNFVQVNPSTAVISKYSNVPSARIGLTITETIVDYITDTSLLDPAIGASNYQAPGADRYQISLTLDTRPLAFGDDSNFIELVRITNGTVQKMVDGSVYNTIDDYFAKRDYETNGDYVVNDFKLTPKTDTSDANSYIMSVGKGLAYVHGYRVENPASVDLVSKRARTTASQNNDPVTADYGSYFYVDNVMGANGYFFDTTTYQSIDLHCVPSANVDTSSANAYNATKVSSGYIRGLVFDHTSNTTAGSTANSYVYKAYVSDLQNQMPTANAAGASSNTITFPSYYSASNSSYVGVTISITAGPDAGDIRTISAYNGVSKVATISQNWTTTPNTSSVFALNYDTKDVDSILAVNGSRSVLGKADIDPESRTNGLSTGTAILENPGDPELIFQVGSPYVATLTSTAYTTQQEWRSVSFTTSGGGVTATLPYTGDYNGVIRHFGTPSTTLSSTTVQQNYTIVVTNAGTSSFYVGQTIPWTTSGRTVALDSTGATATFTATDAGGTFTATIIAKVYVVNADNTGHILKSKTLITANTTVLASSNTQVNTYTFVDNTTGTSTGQIHVQHAGLASPGSAQSLYLSDVKSIVKIVDTGSYGYTTANLANFTDVTSKYKFDNGQRDNYYDHATITLNPGQTQPTGDLVIFANYYQHSGGDGYFSVASYSNDAYTSIPTYTCKAGTTYYLRDCIDFRPARLNAQSSFVFRYSNASTNYGTFLPVDLTTFTGNYSYYLGRRDKLVLSKDKSFQIVEGTPSLDPIYPNEPDGSLVIANIAHDPYTAYLPTEVPTGTIPNLSIDRVKHKRYTMQDIAGLENRINNIEYYTALSLLEQNAQALQISDAFGLNRFKNGIVVDDFSSYSTADTGNADYNATINRRTKQMTATQNVKNFPLKSVATVNNMNLPSATSTSLGYAINTDGYVNYYSLPYTTANVASQKFASRTVNANPFTFSVTQGVLSITPNVDNWVDTNYAPSLLIVDPNLQVYRANAQSLNVLQAGDWKTVTGTTHNFSTSQDYEGGTLVQNFQSYQQTQTNIVGAYDNIGSTYALNNGYITDISILPYIRSQQIVVRAKGLLVNTTLNSYFDNTSVNQYIRRTNVIEVSGVSGTFNEDDVIGYMTGGTPPFIPTGKIVGVHAYAGTTNVRLYVAADAKVTSYANPSTGVIQNAYFDANGLNPTSTASGTLVSQTHNACSVNNAISTTRVQLSPLASSTDSYYVGNTIHFVAGTSAGQSATISTYYGANQTAILSSSVTVANNDVYSIGNFSSDETGAFYGIFAVPVNTFHTGQRVLRIDNSTGGTPSSATTYAESTFYAEGLQTTQQGVDFGASPAGAKNTFTQTSAPQTVTNFVSQWLYRYDPVAQTFMIDEATYPNGVFLNSINLFFRTKPTSDNSPITLSVLGTLNGYPNGVTLDHSVVTVTPDQVNISENPQFVDSTTYTQFNFSAPVYIQPGVLYSFMLHSSSNEYNLWSASNGDTALSSSVKNLPSDATPSTITKIASAPYIGSLFLSQNSQTWVADLNQSLMFVMDRCVFNTTASPTLQFVVPNKLPQRTIIDQSVQYFLNANSISSNVDAYSNTDILVDAFNVTTTDFIPTTSGISYSYNATLATGGAAGTTSITPGKFGTASQDDIYCHDNKGPRILLANTNSSFSLYAQLTTGSDAVSPIISDAGLSTYAIQWNINNCELSNSLITLVSGGTGYNANTTSVTISAPVGSSGSAATATAAANIVGGVIQSVYITYPGTGYITTPTVTITDANSTPGTGASATIAGETSKSGGPALAKYVTKPVILNAGNDSGDLNVYISAYRTPGSDISVYYKILNRNDTQSINDSSWQLMTMINNTAGVYSATRNDIREFVFAPGSANYDQGYVSYTSTNGQTYTTFSQFALKIVLTTTDNTSVPFLTDLRAIALPANVNTTV